MSALYNEIDSKAAAWLRALIAAGHIAPGIVDERSIEDLTPDYLRQFTQVHFFAGIGVWSYALRAAGWPDDRPVWTGSCPCQPFSAAGKGGGFADERHLWPAFHWLISQCQPPVVFGEQVASKDGLGWLDLVQADLEGTGYASGAVDLCAAGVGAPHIRQRLWWFGERLADANRGQRQRLPDFQPAGIFAADAIAPQRGDGLGDNSTGSGRLGDGNQPGLEGRRGRHQAESGRDHAGRPVTEAGGLVGMADDASSSDGRRGLHGPGESIQENIERASDQSVGGGAAGRPGPTNGLWGDADWLHCRDGKWRPVEPGTFPLAHGAPERVGRLRGYGNGLVAPCAQAFVEAYLGASDGI